VSSLVRHPGRPQVVRQDLRVTRARPYPDRARPAVPESNSRATARGTGGQGGTPRPGTRRRRPRPF
jgi:hypothetical protein